METSTIISLIILLCVFCCFSIIIVSIILQKREGFLENYLDYVPKQKKKKVHWSNFNQVKYF